MKKVIFFILSCLLVLGACSNSGNKSTTVSENKPQFKNDTLVLDQAVLYIKDAFVIKDKESENKEIAIKYEVKNKTNKEEITPSSVWTAGVTVKQDEGSTESELDTGMTVVDNGKYKEWLEHYNDTIKKGKKAKGLANLLQMKTIQITTSLAKLLIILKVKTQTLTYKVTLKNKEILIKNKHNNLHLENIVVDTLLLSVAEMFL